MAPYDVNEPLLESPTAGAEAVAQSDAAKAGLKAWKKVQALNGGRPEADWLKAMMVYVLTEGLDAPEARAMAEYLVDHGMPVPGVAQKDGDFDPESEGTAAPDLSFMDDL